MEDTESDGYVIADDIDLAGGSWGFDDMEKGADLPSKEDMQWAADMIDQNGTVLH